MGFCGLPPFDAHPDTQCRKQWETMAILIKLGVLNARMSDKISLEYNKAGYTATKVACGWAGAIFEVIKPFGQDQ